MQVECGRDLPVRFEDRVLHAGLELIDTECTPVGDFRGRKQVNLLPAIIHLRVQNMHCAMFEIDLRIG